MQREVRALAAERNAVILAHNYQRPEVQDVADVVGDSLGLSRQAAATDADAIVFCGVHFMAETASIISPDRTVLIPDLDAGCSLSDSITADQLRGWKAQHPGAVVVMYVNTSAEVKAETDYCCTSSNAVKVVEHIFREHGDDTDVLFGPDMWLGAYVARETGRPLEVWDGECHVHAGIRPADINALRSAEPEADFLIHPECGCTTQVMEYVASGDVAAEGTHFLSTEGMMRHARESERDTMIVATETGILHRMEQESPGKRFIPANRGGRLQLHEDDHAAEAARLAARHEVRGQRAARRRRSRPRADRAHGGHRLEPSSSSARMRGCNAAASSSIQRQRAPSRISVRPSARWSCTRSTRSSTAMLPGRGLHRLPHHRGAAVGREGDALSEHAEGGRRIGAQPRERLAP